jgi:hypothetical protein
LACQFKKEIPNHLIEDMSLPEAKNPPAPLARKKIAHRFIGGSRRQTETSPVRDGRKWFANLLPSLTGLIAFRDIVPSVETPGYFLPAFGLEKHNRVSFVKFLPAPSSPPTIARRFNGGLTEPQTNQVP